MGNYNSHLNFEDDHFEHINVPNVIDRASDNKSESIICNKEYLHQIILLETELKDLRNRFNYLTNEYNTQLHINFYMKHFAGVYFCIYIYGKIYKSK